MMSVIIAAVSTSTFRLLDRFADRQILQLETQVGGNQPNRVTDWQLERSRMESLTLIDGQSCKQTFRVRTGQNGRKLEIRLY